MFQRGTVAAIWLWCIVIAALLLAYRPASIARAAASAVQSPSSQSANAEERQARAVCGGCHAFPPPEILPRDAWRDAFIRMMFIRDNRLPPVGPPDKVYRDIKLPPDMEQVLPFYTRTAPERLPPPEAWPDPSESPLRFERRSLAMTEMPGAPAVSSVNLVDLDNDGRLDVLGADMRQGAIFSARPARGATSLSVVAILPYPARVTLADVDNDGVQDLLVGDLGEFFPADHTKGAVIWLRGRGDGKFGAFWLDGWPRVADVQTADFNGDGRKDLAVAAFGWRKTGQLAILENLTASPSKPDFKTHTIDLRAGGIQMIPADLNRDGRMDFITLLAQEHEAVLAYINKGSNGFSFGRELIYAAPHPNWGSSGIQVVDLDRDNDLDVLLAHGDTFDDGVVKPYHGIQWLENTGGYPFTERTLAQMPGVHAIRATDLDGDGDLDIVAGALLAGGSDLDEKVLPALVWLEQIKTGAFTRRTIEMGFPRHAALDVGDLDGDGDVDIAAGRFFLGDTRSDAWLDVWINPLKKLPPERRER
jgi:FG-GAP-like repeat